MDPFKKNPNIKNLDIENRLGRMMRNMSLVGMPHLESERWFPASDIYESEKELIVCIDVSGVDPQKIAVIARNDGIKVSGERRVILPVEIRSIHQLEIERGFFERTIKLPCNVDVTKTTSSCKDGFLIVRLPKMQKRQRIEIKVV